MQSAEQQRAWRSITELESITDSRPVSLGVNYSCNHIWYLGTGAAFEGVEGEAGLEKWLLYRCTCGAEDRVGLR